MLPLTHECPLCHLVHAEVSYHRITESLTYDFYCPRCHNFIVSHEFLLFGGGESFDSYRHLISGLARELSEKHEKPLKIFESTVNNLLIHPFVPADEDIDAKCEKILQYLKIETRSLGTEVRFYDELDRSVAYARDVNELDALIESLIKRDLLKTALRDSTKENGMFRNLVLTDNGWRYVQKIANSNQDISLASKTTPLKDPPGHTMTTVPISTIEDVPATNTKVMAIYEGLQLHKTVKKVSGSLFRDGHYSQAIFEAYKAVNNEVKNKAGFVDANNDQNLMGKIFSEEKPILRLNQLRDSSEISEQVGFKWLFMGATTGIRNPKAHKNEVEIDPLRTLHYLCFASLLLKMVDDASLVESSSNDKDENS